MFYNVLHNIIRYDPSCMAPGPRNRAGSPVRRRELAKAAAKEAGFGQRVHWDGLGALLGLDFLVGLMVSPKIRPHGDHLGVSFNSVC